MTRHASVRTVVLMDTFVTIKIVGREPRVGANGSGPRGEMADREAALDRAFDWFRHVEAACSRFDPASELSLVSARVGVAVPASPMLCEAVRFALAVAEASGGAFDPTVGQAMAARGFDRNYVTGRRLNVSPSLERVSYRDVHVDIERRTITIERPLLLDLGAVAKGLAIDMAAQELRPFENFAIDAGGDLYLSGVNEEGDIWTTGIRHPRRTETLLGTLHVSDKAVCTSGDYARRAAPADGDNPVQREIQRATTGGLVGESWSHLMDPRSLEGAGAGRSSITAAGRTISATVVAPTAMLADALATAAFVLGPVEGVALLEGQQVDGLIVSPDLTQHATQGMTRDYQFRSDQPTDGTRSEVLQDAQRPPHHRSRSAGGARGAG